MYSNHFSTFNVLFFLLVSTFWYVLLGFVHVCVVTFIIYLFSVTCIFIVVRIKKLLIYTDRVMDIYIGKPYRQPDKEKSRTDRFKVFVTHYSGSVSFCQDSISLLWFLMWAWRGVAGRGEREPRKGWPGADKGWRLAADRMGHTSRFSRPKKSDWRGKGGTWMPWNGWKEERRRMGWPVHHLILRKYRGSKWYMERHFFHYSKDIHCNKTLLEVTCWVRE